MSANWPMSNTRCRSSRFPLFPSVKTRMTSSAVLLLFSLILSRLPLRRAWLKPARARLDQPPAPIRSAAAGGRLRPMIPAVTGSVRQALIAKGVKFPPGASAVYTPTTGQLTVVDTADQMELLEELVNAGQAPTLMVRIATKFVEINQTDLNDLTFNTAFNLFDPYHRQSMLPAGTVKLRFLRPPQFTTALPGSLGFTPDSIDQLITPQAITYQHASFSAGLHLQQQFNGSSRPLSQKKSFDLLSEPAVLTKSGEQGVLEAVRVFPYPISFDPPQLVTQTTTGTITTTSVQFNSAHRHRHHPDRLQASERRRAPGRQAPGGRG